VVWPSHHHLAQNKYDLEKIYVEWSGPLTFVSPKIIMTSSINKCRVVWPSHHSLAQNNYDLQKIKVECGLALSPP
jgi:hypothetical protein